MSGKAEPERSLQEELAVLQMSGEPLSSANSSWEQPGEVALVPWCFGLWW